MTGGEDHAVAVGPMRISGIVSDVLRVERVGQRCQRHRCAGVSRFRRLDGVHREGASGVDGELLQSVGGVGLSHEAVAWRSAHASVRAEVRDGKVIGSASVMRCARWRESSARVPITTASVGTPPQFMVANVVTDAHNCANGTIDDGW